MISTEIQRLQSAKAALKTAIEGKGVTVPADALLDDYAALVDAIQTIPAAYTELEYIESSGTQYINTGYYTKANTTIKAKLYTSDNTNKNWFGGTASVATSNSFAFNSFSTTRLEYIRGAMSWQQVSAINVVGTPFTVEFAPTYININEQKIADIISSNTTDTKTLHLFIRNGGTAYISGRIYYFEIWEDNNLIENLIPAKRNSDNAIGMYDKVSGTFFANVGTGTFSYGELE